MTALLELAGVTKHWGGDLTVLDGVDLAVPGGALACIAGDNGVGKTTLLRIATGVLAPDRGSVRLAGRAPDRDRRAFHRSLGFLPAGDRGLYARLSARQNLDFAAGIAFLRGGARRDAVAAAVDRFGLSAFADRRVDRLSMGQRQRVRLAMTLLHEPGVVLLDEPRTSLDEDGMQLLGDALDRVTAGGGAVLWCAPSVESGLPFDAAYELRDGKLRPW